MERIERKKHEKMNGMGFLLGMTTGTVFVLLIFFLTSRIAIALPVGLAIGLPLGITLEQQFQGIQVFQSRKMKRILVGLLIAGTLFFVFFLLLFLFV